MAADPRIKRHKAQLKADKEAQKKAKEDEQKRRADEAARLEAERRMALEREEQERKRKLDENRMEAAKRAQELKALQEELKAIVKVCRYILVGLLLAYLRKPVIEEQLLCRTQSEGTGRLKPRRKTVQDLHICLARGIREACSGHE